MQFTPFVFCCCWSASKIVDVSAADHIRPHIHGELTAPNGGKRRLVGGRRVGIKRKKISVLNGEVATTGTRQRRPYMQPRRDGRMARNGMSTAVM